MMTSVYLKVKFDKGYLADGQPHAREVKEMKTYSAIVFDIVGTTSKWMLCASLDATRMSHRV